MKMQVDNSVGERLTSVEVAAKDSYVSVSDDQRSRQVASVQLLNLQRLVRVERHCQRLLLPIANTFEEHLQHNHDIGNHTCLCREHVYYMNVTLNDKLQTHRHVKAQYCAVYLELVVTWQRDLYSRPVLHRRHRHLRVFTGREPRHDVIVSTQSRQRKYDQTAA